MNPTRTYSVVPNASILIEEWEREAAGKSEHDSAPPSRDWPMVLVGSLALMSSVLLMVVIGWSIGRWLCGC